MRGFLTVAAVLALSACQTVPHKLGFSEKQVAALTGAEFKPVGDNYELGLSDRVLFAVNQSDLSAEAVVTIDKLAAVLTSVGCLVFLFKLRLFDELTMVEHFALLDDRTNRPRIADILERVVIQNEEIGLLAFLDRSQVRLTKE